MINCVKNFAGKCSKRIICVALAMIVTLSMVMIGFSSYATKASTLTGSGLASWAMRAYNEGWNYVWGGSSVGSVDCSGLIYSYVGGGARTTEAMLASASQSGSISSLPDEAGIILYQYGHVGVYVGGGMAVDARNEQYDVCYSSVSSHGWTKWFRHPSLSYSGSSSVVNNNSGSTSKSSNSGSSTSSSNNTLGSSGTSSSSNNSSSSGTSDSSSTYDQSTQTTKKKKSNVLRLGSSGKKIIRLQKRLKKLRYYNDSISGYFGSMTRKAVKKFQKNSGLTATGVIDANTKYVLYSNLAVKYTPNVFKLGMNYSEVRAYQKKLIKLDYLAKGSASSYFGTSTKKAVKAFQVVAKLKKTGTLNQKTIAKLTSKNAPANPYTVFLASGSTDTNAVQNMQNRLLELRYVQAYNSGVFDEVTVNGLSQFQATNNLKVTGSLTRQSNDVLYSDKAEWSAEAEDLKVGFAGEDVARLQTNLQTLGYYNGEVSSFFDTATEEAVKAFEEDNGLSVDGVASLSVRIAIDATISSSDVEKTTNQGYEVSSLTNNSLAPKTGNSTLIIVVSIIAGLVIAVLASLLLIKKKKLRKGRHS